MKRKRLILFALMAVTPQLRATTSANTLTTQEILTYKVKEIKGDGYAWQQAQASWAQIKPNMLMLETSLIQLTSGTRLTVINLPSPSYRIRHEMEFQSKEQILTRLSEKSMRNFTMGGYFIAIPQDLLKAKTPTDFFGPIQGSWKRFASMFNFSDDSGDVEESSESTPGTPPQSKNKQQPPQDSRINSFKEMVLTYPRNGESLLVGEFPTDIAAVWEKPEGPDRQYLVYFTKSDSPKEKLAGKTGEDFFNIHITDPGNYEIYVETTDGTYKSRRHRLVIDTL